MTLKQIANLQADFDEHHAGTFRWGRTVDEESPSILEHSLVCLVGEIGEFANILKKINRGDQAYSDAKSALTEELADTFIYVIQIANQMGVDLETEFTTKLRMNWERFGKYEQSLQRAEPSQDDNA